MASHLVRESTGPSNRATAVFHNHRTHANDCPSATNAPAGTPCPKRRTARPSVSMRYRPTKQRSHTIPLCGRPRSTTADTRHYRRDRRMLKGCFLRRSAVWPFASPAPVATNGACRAEPLPSLATRPIRNVEIAPAACNGRSLSTGHAARLASASTTLQQPLPENRELASCHNSRLVSLDRDHLDLQFTDHLQDGNHQGRDVARGKIAVPQP